MTTDFPSGIIDLAEAHRGELSAEFFTYYDNLERALSEGRLPERLQKKGSTGSEWFDKLGPAIISELRVFLCTDDERYSEVRSAGKKLSEAAVTAMAGYLAAHLGLALGLVTGAVAFIALAALKLGAGVFCEVTA